VLRVVRLLLVLLVVVSWDAAAAQQLMQLANGV
jgi:hypothetical protein